MIADLRTSGLTLNDLLKTILPHAQIKSVEELIPSMSDIFIEVVDFLKNEELDIPAIPAGGIFTGSDAVDYMIVKSQ